MRLTVLRGFIVFLIACLGGAFVVAAQGVASMVTGPSSNPSPDSADDLDSYWANEILSNQKYILWFRHGEREKWEGTVTVFDYFEWELGLDGESETWEKAVCLTDKGIEETKIVGETFMHLGLRPAYLVSSPSCRAMQTAEYAFGDLIPEIWKEVLHATAVAPSQRPAFAASLRQKVLLLSDFTRTGNVVVTGHGNTLNFYQGTLFDQNDVPEAKWAMNELGFAVIEVTDNRIVAHHVFSDFYAFANKVLLYSD
jgi:broad specificity phosphatase PhoE